MLYADCPGAIEWEKVFGFKTTMLATGNDSNAMYAGMKFENGYITIGGEWENVKAPSSIGGADTQNIHVHLEGVDEHCERARAAGAMIVQEPEDQFHGERTYRAIDPQGHMWIFGQTLRVLTNEELEAAVPGKKISTPQ